MKIPVLVAAALTIAACGGSSDKETVGKEIADDYNEAMDKAREVEDKLMEHKADIDDAMNKAMDGAEDAVDKSDDEK